MRALEHNTPFHKLTCNAPSQTPCPHVTGLFKRKQKCPPEKAIGLFPLASCGWESGREMPIKPMFGFNRLVVAHYVVNQTMKATILKRKLQRQVWSSLRLFWAVVEIPQLIAA